VGQEGILHLDATDGFTKSQALASHVLDKVGAGDAVLAVTSLLEKIGAPTDIIGFIGNVAGAHVVASLGNAVPLDRVTLSRHITSLLK
jgi:bifunctional ADP-heptose synthase (sugar kinase/adenylyltransferase)